MADDLPVFDAVKPIGKCGACSRELYPHSSPNICDYRQDCPMHSDRWRKLKLGYDMQNTFVR